MLSCGEEVPSGQQSMEVRGLVSEQSNAYIESVDELMLFLSWLFLRNRHPLHNQSIHHKHGKWIGILG